MTEAIKNIPYTNAPAENWVLWHKALKKRYGKAEANRLFLAAYKKRVTATIPNFLNLQAYMKKQGIKLEGNWVQELEGSFSDGFAGLQTALGVAGGFAVLIVLLILGLATFVVVLIVNQPEKSTKLAALARPI
jgi:hypothetical protein